MRYEMAKVRGLRKRGKHYYARYPDGTGKMKQECTKCTNLKDAIAFLEERHRQVREGKLPHAKRLLNCTFKEFAKDYLIWAERQKDYRNKKHFVNKLIDEFGNLPLQKFNKLIIDRYQSKRLTDGLKPASVNRYIAVLKHMFTMAYDWDMIGEHIYRQVKKVKQLPVDNMRLRYLPEDECFILIESCEEHLKPIVITALNTGMRKGEILNLKWHNVKLINDIIQAENTKNNESRQLPINDTLRNILSKLPRRLDVEYVFYNPQTVKPYTDLKKSFALACKNAKLHDVTFHTLRHTFASHLVMEGIDLVRVKELMGHKDIKMTLRYAHLAPSHKEKSVTKLDGIFAGGQKLAKNGESKNVKTA